MNSKDPKTLACICAKKILCPEASSLVTGDCKLRDNIETAVKALPPESLQHKVLAASLCASYNSNTLGSRWGFKKKKVASSRRQFNCIIWGIELKKTIIHRKMYELTQVEHVVKYILRDSNVQRVSWGTKTVLLKGEEVNFPRLIRRKEIELMWREYVDRHPDPRDRVGETSFKKIAKGITSSDMKACKAVDYVSGILMYENFDKLRAIVYRCPYEQPHLLKLVDSLEAFIKKKCEEHVGKCHATNVTFALQKSGEYSEVSCEECSIPKKIIAYIRT